jgi:hypothetical protein
MMINVLFVIVTRFHRILLDIIYKSLWWSVEIDCMLSLSGSFGKITFAKDILELLSSANNVRELLRKFLYFIIFDVISRCL